MWNPLHWIALNVPYLVVVAVFIFTSTQVVYFIFYRTKFFWIPKLQEKARVTAFKQDRARLMNMNQTLTEKGVGTEEQFNSIEEEWRMAKETVEHAKKVSGETSAR